jgi:hypothetical protein
MAPYSFRTEPSFRLFGGKGRPSQRGLANKLVRCKALFGVLVLATVVAILPAAVAQVTTIDGLTKISVVGSVETIVDAQGNTITVESDPYKVVIGPSGDFFTGDILVSNLGASTKGSAIVRFFGQQGPGHLFNPTPSGLVGPVGLAFDNGKLLVASSNAMPSSVQVFNPDGTLFASISDPLFNGVWGLSAGRKQEEMEESDDDSDEGPRFRSFFVTNKRDAKILRVDEIRDRAQGQILFRVVQVGQFDKTPGLPTKIDVHWLRRLKVGQQKLRDVLVGLDPVNNRVAAFAHSSVMQGTGNGMTVFQGKPLNIPCGLAMNPINGDLLVVNCGDNNLVEINMTTTTVVGVKQIDPAPVDAEGNGSALFGVAAIKDRAGNLRVFYTDDNTNTLNVLSVP